MRAKRSLSQSMPLANFNNADTLIPREKAKHRRCAYFAGCVLKNKRPRILTVRPLKILLFEGFVVRYANSLLEED
jgi:hypothetical protein